LKITDILAVADTISIYRKNRYLRWQFLVSEDQNNILVRAGWKATFVADDTDTSPEKTGIALVAGAGGETVLAFRRCRFSSASSLLVLSK